MGGAGWRCGAQFLTSPAPSHAALPALPEDPRLGEDALAVAMVRDLGAIPAPRARRALRARGACRAEAGPSDALCVTAPRAAAQVPGATGGVGGGLVAVARRGGELLLADVSPPPSY